MGGTFAPKLDLQHMKRYYALRHEHKGQVSSLDRPTCNLGGSWSSQATMVQHGLAVPLRLVQACIEQAVSTYSLTSVRRYVATGRQLIHCGCPTDLRSFWWVKRLSITVGTTTALLTTFAARPVHHTYSKMQLAIPPYPYPNAMNSLLHSPSHLCSRN